MYLLNFSEANRYQLIENYTKAIELYNICIELNPESAASYYQLSKIYFEKKDYQQALFNAQKSTELNSENYWYIDNYATILLENNEIELAYQKHLDLVTSANDSTWLYNICEKYNEKNLLQNEMNLLNSYNEILFDSIFFNRKLILQLSLGLISEQKASYLKLTEYYPSELKFTLDLINFYLKNNYSDEAKILINKLENKHFNEFCFYTSYISVSDKDCGTLKNNFADGFKSFYISDNQKIELFYLYENSELNCFEDETLLNVYKNIYSENSDNDEFVKIYLTKLIELKNFSESLTVSNSISKNVKDLDLILLISEVYFNNSNFTELLEFEKNAIDIYPNQPDLYLFAGIAAFNLKDIKTAKTYLTSGKNLIIDNKLLTEKFNEYLSKLH